MDWGHLNTVVPFPNKTTLLISSRNQNTLFKVDRETDEIVWALGINGEFEMSEEDRFYHQHDPEIQDNGNIVMFDNGDPAIRPYSRAIEVAYDEDGGTAEVVWAYRHDPDIFSNIWGDADRLTNGNTLVTFGLRRANIGSTIVEVSPDGTEV